MTNKNKNSPPASPGAEPQLKQVKTSHTVQVNPLHVDMIVRQIIEKQNWQDKIEELSAKWQSECLDQNISLASTKVAFDILRDIQFKGRGVKRCCGCCGADPKPEPRDEDEEEMEEELEQYYPRSTKFCLCPCPHCALDIELVSDTTVCTIHDGLIPDDLTQQLKCEIAKLEQVPEEKKDWHPGSNHQVLDLVHPSLFCYSKKFSQFVENSPHKNKPVPVEEEKPRNIWYGRKTKPEAKHQWMPTEFQVDDDKATPLSYINNVCPTRQKPLQDAISKILHCFVPYFAPFTNSEKLQVIVKAANVIVTPEQGFYSGGTWHTEGLNENIVATGIYYYESENVKDSYLEFRSSVDDSDIDYEQDNVRQAFESSGLHDGDLLFNPLGSVETKQGRCIVFPNTNQHRVRHFFLDDSTKPAVRKILVFFLVDPKKPIISTSDVDIQRKDFLMNRCFSLAKLIPLEVVGRIVQYMPHMTLQQAQEEREELMKERKYHIQQENEETYEREFSLCEH